MATAADILKVKANLEGTDHGWADDHIGELLDALGSPSKVIQSFWSAKVNELYLLTDVSESGSSRNMTSAYTHAMEQLRRWDDIVKQEDEDAKDEAGRVHFRPITRELP